jgi:hypothetical protein
VLGPGGRARRAAPNWAGDGDASVRREELRGSAGRRQCRRGRRRRHRSEETAGSGIRRRRLSEMKWWARGENLGLRYEIKCLSVTPGTFIG